MHSKPNLDALLVGALAHYQMRDTALGLLVADSVNAGFRFVRSRTGDTAAIVFVDNDGNCDVYSCNDGETVRLQRAAELWKAHRGGPHFQSLFDALRDEESYARSRRAAA
ncbi:MAG: hypothetical protein ACHREM_00895 [Polyangiales bacterium]